MEKLTYKLRTAACIVALTFGVFGCAEEFTEPTPVSGVTIVDVVKASADFNILYAALKKTNLEGSFDNVNSGSYTVFAPTDAAFLAYLQSSAVYNNGGLTEAQAILNIQNLTNTSTPLNIGQLATRLNYHIVSSEITTSMITVANGFNTLNGGRLSLSKQGATILLNANGASVTAAGNGATIAATDDTPVNGIIHSIDRFLNAVTVTNVLTGIGYGATPVSYATNPPTISGGTATDATDTDYDLFAVALRKTSLCLVVFPNASPLPDYTLFAPRDLPFRTYLATLSGTVTNEATAATFINSLTDGNATADPPILPTSPTLTEFTNLIKYHIVAGRVLTSDLTSGQAVTTLLTGKTFTPTVGGTVTIADQNGVSVDATIVSINNLTNAGVYQGLDNVLIPN